MALAVQVDRRKDGALRLRLAGFDDLDRCEYPTVVAALGAHLGLDASGLRKAAGSAPEHGEPLDPRFPALGKLVDRARSDWDTWGGRLVDEVVELVRSGRLLPSTPEGERALRAIFRDHEVAIIARFTGAGADASELVRLRAVGLLPERGFSFVELAWRLGRQVSSLRGPPGLPTSAEERRPLEETIRALVKRPLTPEDQHALGFVQRRAAVYMRRPAQQATASLSRVLSDEEYRLLRGGLVRAVEQRQGWRATASRLGDALKGNPTLINDLDRVAKTELHFAHAEGALKTLREDASELGEADPEVYKLVAPQACAACRRIWGPMSSPVRYRLSFVLSRNEGRGNFGLPQAEWGPCSGPIHPNCTEGPLHIWIPRLHGKVMALAATMAARYGS